MLLGQKGSLSTCQVTKLQCWGVGKNLNKNKSLNFSASATRAPDSSYDKTATKSLHHSKQLCMWEQLWILHAAEATSSPEETHGTPCAWNQSCLKICHRCLNTLSTHTQAHAYTRSPSLLSVWGLSETSHFTALIRKNNRSPDPDLNLNPVLTSTLSVHRNPQTHLCAVLKLWGSKKNKNKFSLC